MKAGLVRLLGSGFVIAAVAIFAGNAEASSVVTLPDAYYTTSVHATEPNGFQHTQSTHLPVSGLNVNGGNPNYNPPKTWIAQVANDYQIPSLTAGVTVDTGVAGSAGSNLTYYVAFSGADGLVPITIRAGGSASLATFDTAEGTPSPTLQDNRSAAFINIYEASDQTHRVVQLYAESNFDDSPGEHLFTLDQQYMLKANTIYEVDMYATVFAAYGRTGAAFVDPNFSAPAGYNVLTSAGIGNTAAVTPIPATLPLFTSGLGALGVLGWRNRKRAARAA
jgi:hypothetical protein